MYKYFKIYSKIKDITKINAGTVMSVDTQLLLYKSSQKQCSLVSENFFKLKAIP